MQNRDTFTRQTGMLNQQAPGTRQLTGPGTRPLTDPGSLKSQVEALLAKGNGTLQNLEPRMELLIRSCGACGLPLPGVDYGAFKHPVSPKGEQIIGYVAGVLKTNQALARQVQVAVFRFQEASKAVDTATASVAAGTLRPEILEDLKLKLFYMSRLHEEFKGDPVLAQLFPPPQTMTGPLKRPGTAPLSMADRLKAKQARQAILHKAEVLASKLGPKIEVVKLTIEAVEKPSLNIGQLFTPATRQARLIAMSLGNNKELVDQLRQAVTLYEKLQKMLPDARTSEDDLEPLKDVIQPLSQLALTFKQNAVIKDLFPLGETELFPEQEGQS